MFIENLISIILSPIFNFIISKAIWVIALLIMFLVLFWFIKNKICHNKIVAAIVSIVIIFISFNILSFINIT